MFSNIVPIQTIIFDEASQIEVGDYLPLLHRFPHNLKKMVFIGDDRQRESL
jgi:regulator of nonsense transcripts 1